MNRPTPNAKRNKVESSAAATAETELTPEEEEAMAMQRKFHQSRPTVMGVIKAMFMWREYPEERPESGK